MIDLRWTLDENSLYDISIVDGAVEETQGLDTAILMSLFCNARASKDQIINPLNRQGWWGSLTNWFSKEVGSKLWLYEQSRLSDSVLSQVEAVTKEALDWMLKDNLAKTVNVSVSRPYNDTIRIDVKLVSPDNSVARHFYTMTRDSG